jgi:hypothetical protein
LTSADSYECFVELTTAHLDFVIRLNYDRRIEGDGERVSLKEQSSGGPVLFDHFVPISARSGKGRTPKAKKAHPPRVTRLAHLTVKSGTVVMPRPSRLPGSLPASLKLNVVRVQEPCPPPGQEPVDWTLLTTLPVGTAEEAARVVHIYCLRWLIEEYFGALKTGCALSTRQPESLKTALVMLALCIPVAWTLLLMRQLERRSPTTAAGKILSKTRLQVLRAFAPKGSLPPRPGIRHVLAAIAALGGHRKSNGPPGWKVLGRGYIRLLELEAGWIAALDSHSRLRWRTPA